MGPSIARLFVPLCLLSLCGAGLAQQPAQQMAAVKVTAENAKVYREPDATGAPVGKVEYDQRYVAVEAKAGWVKLLWSAEQAHAWIENKAVAPAPERFFAAIGAPGIPTGWLVVPMGYVAKVQVGAQTVVIEHTSMVPGSEQPLQGAAIPGTFMKLVAYAGKKVAVPATALLPAMAPQPEKRGIVNGLPTSIQDHALEATAFRGDDGQPLFRRPGGDAFAFFTRDGRPYQGGTITGPIGR